MKRFIISAIVLAAALRLAIPAAAQVDEQVIYGSDDRIDLYQTTNAKLLSLADSTVALMPSAWITAEGPISRLATQAYGPSQELCKDEPFYDQITAAFCSGSLVAPDIIMTAGHCITNDSICADTQFVFGFAVKEKDKMPLTVATSDVYGCMKLLGRERNDLGADWALIKLDRPVTGHEVLRLNLTGVIEKNTPLLVIGHPSGLPTKIAGGAEVRDASKDGFFVANLDTYGGNSGSAVFNAQNGLVEGILVRGENDFVPRGSCNVSYVCPADACRGEDVTRVSAVTDRLPGAQHRSRVVEMGPTFASLMKSVDADAEAVAVPAARP